jgi:tetratricopeptide (TPR) repeat protein
MRLTLLFWKHQRKRRATIGGAMNRGQCCIGLHRLRRFLSCAVLIAITALFFISCTQSGTISNGKFDSYYISGSPMEKKSLSDLFLALSNENASEIDKFFIVREIANVFSQQKQYGRLANFLSAWSQENPDGIYNTYYLLGIADAYIKQNAYPVAAVYFDMIVKNYPDLIIRGNSIHLECLKQLIELTDDDSQKIWYYEELLSRFKNDIDAGPTYFLLGQTYEALGEWNKAIESYAQFLPYYITSIPGYPDAYAYAKQLVDFNNSQKNWAFESLQSMINTIEAALDAGNIYQLWQHRAKVNFFARSWAQGESDDAGMAEFNLSTFASSKIRYADNLESGSNANEAYLRTSGWSSLLTTVWYFYFRKIYFPPDPEIHGIWEWAGIFYGEKF